MCSTMLGLSQVSFMSRWHKFISKQKDSIQSTKRQSKIIMEISMLTSNNSPLNGNQVLSLRQKPHKMSILTKELPITTQNHFQAIQNITCNATKI